MRDLLLKLVIVAMLFVTLEGTAEPFDEETSHQTHHAHADGGDQRVHEDDADDHECEACRHFCHVHVIALPSQTTTPEPLMIGASVLSPSIRFVTRNTSPPTPPPDI